MSIVMVDKAIEQSTIYLSEGMLNYHGITERKIILHFGALQKELIINTLNTLNPETITLPQQLTRNVSIPDLPYEYYFKGNHLYLGPVIGFLAREKYYTNPHEVVQRFSNYHEIKGLLFIFWKGSIDTKNKLIKGLYFNPATASYSEGTFPYPNVIFKRVYLNKKMMMHFEKYIGQNKIFNSIYNLNKWRFWSIVSKNPNLKPHLPHTIKFIDMASLLQMVKQYQSVYLKPTSLSSGRGIVRVENTGNGYKLVNHSSQTRIIRNKRELSHALKDNIKNHYLIQQDIPMYVKSQKVDFRFYFHKDKDKKWYCSGMETKVAKPGSIISNFNNRAKSMPVGQALSKLYNLSPDQVQEMQAKIARICIEALVTIEENNHHLGEAAIDLIVDRDWNVWLLEAQLCFAATKKYKRDRAEQLVLPKILPAPFEYAKALANFPPSNRNKEHF